ncbi:beta-mannosidase [Metabacillus litoralis]|uniref:beta-mannosidase n=1 Tax=Metabacillus litoralis TaxID=152268 RepID=UPI001CFE6E23|nr:glycoside hydrolase family 2 protein [Metabacillus litoralis]
MKIHSLNGNWDFKNSAEEKWQEGVVPGSLLADLYRLNIIDDPYYRDNEDKLYKLFNFDYVYRKKFSLKAQDFKGLSALLRFEGIDTIADIFLNGHHIGQTSNMHRTYEYSVEKYLFHGSNEIVVKLKSPLKYIHNKQHQLPLYGISMAVPGYTHIRKGHYMYGWDWGPQLPDCGLWRDVSLLFSSGTRFSDINIEQIHDIDMVKLKINMSIDNPSKELVAATVKITSPDGQIKIIESKVKEKELFEISIENPKLWWPNGFGEQPLYLVEYELKDIYNVSLDEKSMNIGLRTITVNTEPDQWGSKFAFCVNGIEFFAMGADYIPEDNVVSWASKKKTERLLENCVKANFNMIRVWGGGIYPSDQFYDLCDKHGLIVWQDLMFACGVYDLENQDFVEDSLLEIKDNVKRIRHHACLGLICGNNEIEMFFEDGRIPKTDRNKENYVRFFEEKIPQMISEITPQLFYWPGSPSSGGNFFDTNGENHGDGHYWDVWHGNKPFTAYRDTYFRFMSEFGFESLPNIKTIESFTEVEDRNLFSYIMEKHQKNPDGNTKILTYLANNFQNPKDFSSLVYTSQILQAEAMRYGVEHWRRNRERCMGALYWQLNDCWPTSSWSSIDYHGRWKALHYSAKKFFAPILLSAKEDGTNIELHLSNETLYEWEGSVSWYLMKNNGEIIQKETFSVNINKLSTTQLFTKEFDLEDSRNVFFYFRLEKNGEIISNGSVLFEPAKYFNFQDPKLDLKIDETEERFQIKVHSQSFAKYVELSVKDIDVIFSDNYFDVPVGEEIVVSINKKEYPNLTVNSLEENIMVQSYFDSY